MHDVCVTIRSLPTSLTTAESFALFFFYLVKTGAVLAKVNDYRLISDKIGGK